MINLHIFPSLFFLKLHSAKTSASGADTETPLTNHKSV